MGAWYDEIPDKVMSLMEEYIPEEEEAQFFWKKNKHLSEDEIITKLEKLEEEEN